MGYKEKVAMATMLESMGKKKKKAQLRKDIEEAKKQGFDVTIKYDPATGEYAPTFSYKQPTKTQAEKDADITEIFQQDAQQAYGGDMAGVKTADIPQRMGQQTRGEIQAGATQRYGKPFYTSPNMNPQQQQQRLQTKADIKGIPTTAGNIQDFRKPFDAAGQIMRPDKSGQFAPINKPDAMGGYGGGGITQLGRDKILGALRIGKGKIIGPYGQEITVDLDTQEKAVAYMQKEGMLQNKWQQDPEIIAELKKLPSPKEVEKEVETKRMQEKIDDAIDELGEKRFNSLLKRAEQHDEKAKQELRSRGLIAPAGEAR